MLTPAISFQMFFDPAQSAVLLQHLLHVVAAADRSYETIEDLVRKGMSGVFGLRGDCICDDVAFHFPGAPLGVTFAD